MEIRIKKETKKGFETAFNFLYYGIPILLFFHSGMVSLVGSKYLIQDVIAFDVFRISGLILFFQIVFYNRKNIFYWLKDWKRRNIKHGVLEI